MLHQKPKASTAGCLILFLKQHFSFTYAMKKLLILLAACSISAAASAQTTPVKAAPGQHQMHKKDHKQEDLTPEQRADRAAQKLTKSLNLSAAQTQQVRQLHLARIQQQQARKAANGTVANADRKARHQAMKGQKAQYDAQLKQILSADQYTKYAQMQADRKAKYQAKRQTKG